MRGITIQFIRQLSAVANQRTDGDLLTGFLTDNVEADFAELIRRYGPIVWGVCRRALPDQADAEDAFQTVFLVLVRRGNKLTGHANIGPWLYQVAIWTTRNIRRRNAYRISKNAALTDEVPATATDLDLSLDIDDALLALPEKFRSSIVLCHLMGYSRADAAAQLGCREGTLSSWLSRGLARLRAKLGDRDPARVLGLASVAQTVPASLSSSVVRAAVAFHTTAAVSSALSSTLPQLIEGVMRMFWVKKATAATVALFTMFAFGVGVGVSTFQIAPAADGQENVVLTKGGAQKEEGSRAAAEDLDFDGLLGPLQEELLNTAKLCHIVEEALKASTLEVKKHQLDAMLKKNQNQPVDPNELKNAVDTCDRFQKDLDTFEKRINELKGLIVTLHDLKREYENDVAMKAKQSLERYTETFAHNATPESPDDIDKKIAMLKKQQEDLKAKMGAEKANSKLKEETLRLQLKKIEDEIVALVKQKAFNQVYPSIAKTTNAYFQLIVETKDAAWPFVIKEFGPDGKPIGKTAFENSAVLARFLARAMKDSSAPREIKIIAQANTPVELLTSALEACKASGVAQSHFQTTYANQIEKWFELADKFNKTVELEAAKKAHSATYRKDYAEYLKRLQQNQDQKKKIRDAAGNALDWLEKQQKDDPPSPPKP